MARYAEKEAPLLERIIMQEGLERSKAEDWARDEITRLSEENARLREELQKDFNAMRVFARYRELEAEIETLRGMLREAHVKMEANNLWSNLRHRVAAAIREGGKDDI